MKRTDEFYIGWMPQAPAGIASHSRKVIVALLLIAITVGVLVSLRQRAFSPGKFEFGQLTEVTGIYQQTPVPSLKVISQTDALGNTSYITMPLVGYGKSGADGVISSLEKQYLFSLDNKQVTFAGTLIYSEGKTLLQIDINDNPLKQVNPQAIAAPTRTTKELGTMELQGEILDPKCYFGVMKPGRGKPHRDCAIRCIAGGISPVFYVRNQKGESAYYLLLDENGKRLNEVIGDNVAEPVTLTARAVQVDDWIVLYAQRSSIVRTGGLSWFKRDDVSCGKPH